MQQRVSVITLPVADIARSKTFYCNGLGWQLAFENEQVLFFQINGLVLALFQRDAYAEDTTRPYHPGSSTCALGHNTLNREEVDAVYQQALNAGAEAVKKPQDTFWGGYAGYFADPDGHMWEIAHNPFWPISEEGYTTFKG